MPFISYPGMPYMIYPTPQQQFYPPAYQDLIPNYDSQSGQQITYEFEIDSPPASGTNDEIHDEEVRQKLIEDLLGEDKSNNRYSNLQMISVSQSRGKFFN